MNSRGPPPGQRRPMPPAPPPQSQHYSQSQPQAQAFQLRPTKSPDESFIFGNLVGFNAQDIPVHPNSKDVYVLVNDRFVFTARPDRRIEPGHLSLSDPQRSWAGVALTDYVKVSLYEPFSQDKKQYYLTSLDLSIAFAGRRTTETPYDQDELAQHVSRVFENQILAPGQQFLMDMKSIPLRLTVRTVQLGDLAMFEKPGASSSMPTTSEPTARGILTRNTTMNFFKDAQKQPPVNLKASSRRPAANAIVQPDFKFENMGIGGLDSEFSTIFRRAFASRIFPPSLVEKIGIQHVKGVLLYGPPGTGKTLIARQIGKMLNAREPKIINGPEILNKYVGQSEENVRKMFIDAEKEYKEKGDESGLHIIIFDELDAVCKQRGSGSAGGTGVGDSVVNQLLSKLDGVDQLNNILLIGMTNRLDMIDDALLRPGRLEVKVEITLPDENGRQQIFKIHTAKMKENNLLAPDVSITELASLTKNYSGAEITGVVKAASSFAFNRHTKAGTMAGVSDDVSQLQLTRPDFLHGLDEVRPAFGVSEDDLERRLEDGILHFSADIESILRDAQRFVNKFGGDDTSSIRSVLFHGPRGAGKTALAARVALDSGYPFVRQIAAEEIPVGSNEAGKLAHIERVFADAYKSKLSMVILDRIESLIEWNDLGPRFNNNLLIAISNKLGRPPPTKGHRIFILATTSEFSALRMLKLTNDFSESIAVPNVNSQQELDALLRQVGAFGDDAGARRRAIGTLEELTGTKRIGIGVKAVLSKYKMVRGDEDEVTRFAELLAAAAEPGADSRAGAGAGATIGYEPGDEPAFDSQLMGGPRGGR